MSMYYPNKQLWDGEKCKFWNHPFMGEEEEEEEEEEGEPTLGPRSLNFCKWAAVYWAA